MHLSENRCFDTTQLKLIAMVLMVLDHIYEFFSYTELIPIWFTWLGRLVFPIFMFTMTEGFYFTRSKEKYMMRLYIGSAAMGIFNYLLVSIFPREDGFLILNNIFGTFFITVFYLYYIEKIKENRRDGQNIIPTVAAMIVPILLSAIPSLFTFISYRLEFDPPPSLYILLNGLIPSPLFVEGGPFLVILGIIMYDLRNNRLKQVIVYVFICLSLYTGGGFNIKNLLYVNYQWMMVFSVIFMLLYNGNKGIGYKYLFYIFYPVHVYILYILSVIIISK
nr:TraX family protein [Sedimentibacter sp.]